MKLKNAVLCGNCDEVYDRSLSRCCPLCVSPYSEYIKDMLSECGKGDDEPITVHHENGDLTIGAVQVKFDNYDDLPKLPQDVIPLAVVPAGTLLTEDALDGLLKAVNSNVMKTGRK